MNIHSIGQAEPDLRKALPALDVIWQFMYDADAPNETDALLCLCSFDTSVAYTTADLYQRGCAPWVVVSGGQAHQADVATTGWIALRPMYSQRFLNAKACPPHALFKKQRVKIPAKTSSSA